MSESSIREEVELAKDICQELLDALKALKFGGPKDDVIVSYTVLNRLILSIAAIPGPQLYDALNPKD